MKSWQRTLIALAVLGAAARPVHAQAAADGSEEPPTGLAAVDSAAAARAAWARASAALRANDMAGARREIDRAALAWPTQPAYVWARAVLAARAGDTTTALAALAHYASLGLGHDLTTDPSIAALVKAPELAELATLHARNRRPLDRGTVRARLSDSSFWPEGMDYDPHGHRFFVASVRHRTIAEIDAQGRVRELMPRGQPTLGAILGVRFDAARGVLWATTSGMPQTEGYVPADSAIGALLRIRIADGAIERRWDVPVARGGHVLGDLAVGPRGDIFFTDSNEPVLYRLRPNADTLQAIHHPLFRNLQGMAPAPDGRSLYVADYSHGLLRVDLDRGTVRRLDDAPHSTSLGCDGLAWDRGAIVAVQNGVLPPRVVRFTLDASGTRITNVQVIDRNSLADEPTIGAVVGGDFVYVANSQWDKHDAHGAPMPEKALTAPILLAAPLPR